MHDNHKSKHGKWACCWVGVPGERSSHVRTAHEAAREQTHQWWKWWQTHSMGKAASHNICLCFVYKLVSVVPKIFQNSSKVSSSFTNPLFLWAWWEQCECHTFKGQKSWWAWVTFLSWLTMTITTTPIPNNYDFSGCGDVALFLWVLMCIRFAQQRYALGVSPPAATGTEALG